MRVVVLRGGRSSEHDVSLRSGAAVAAGLREAGHEVVEVTIERDGRWLCDGELVELIPARGLLGADVVFPVLHGPFGEDGTVQGTLETLDVPYAGPGVLAAATTIDKITFKRLLAERGLPQVDYCAVGEPGWREKADELGLPLWVKPARLGSSVGIVKVNSLDQLDAAVEEAGTYDPRVIIEAHGAGLEIECSVLGNEKPFVSVPGEIVANADWYDFEAKYEAGGMDLVVPARIPDDVTGEVKALAAAVFEACACTGLARCDFFVDPDDGHRILVNELNTIPGFTDTSVYARLLEEDGIAYPDLCSRLVELGLERHRHERSFQY